MDVGCSLKLFVASTMKPQNHLLSPTPYLSKKSPPPTQVLQYKGAPICPSTAYQGAKTLYTYDMDVGCLLKLFVASTMTPQHHLLSPTPHRSKNSPPPAPVKQCKGAPICPSTAYQGAKTLCIHMVWMRDAVQSCLQTQP